MLVGLAVGDALGAPVEFDSAASIAGRRRELTRFPGGGGFNWAPGEFTDDTQMALVLARRLLADGELKRDALAADFAAWAVHPATLDVGIQTRGVLSAVARGRPWLIAAAELPPDAAGNGSLMRVAPIVLLPELNLMELARQQSMVTHPNPLCVDACAVYIEALRLAMRGVRVDLDELAKQAREPEVCDAVLAARADASPVMSGYVLHTLTGALWAFRGARRFSDAVWRAVSLGEDADTVGAVTGALAGAYWGLNGIPVSFRRRLTTRHPLFAGDYPALLEHLADAIVDNTAGDAAEHVMLWWRSGRR